MKTTSTTSLIVALASAGSALALPRPASRSTAGLFQFACETQDEKPLLLFPDGNESSGKNISVAVLDGKLAADASLAQPQTYLFETCPSASYMGYSANFSRNSGGSMGAPLENWGHLKDPSTGQCVKHNDDNTFSPANCSYANDASQLQFWWRLQEGLSVKLDWFPVRNESGFQYNGQTPYTWVPLDSNNTDVLRIEAASNNSWTGILSLGSPYS